MDSEILQAKGRIFNIQRFSLHDGKGIRTIVFFKGCPMRCRWCCNPESQEWQIQKLIENSGEKTVGRDVTVDEVLTEILKDRIYYTRSGGGLTLSGGECLGQPVYAFSLLKAAKEFGINTAIETCAYVGRSVIENCLPYIDTFLVDIKHMNSEKHKAFTTRENEKILDNSRYIAANSKQMIVRVPVIPTFNDTEEEIAAIAAFVKGLCTVKQMHLLPYHKIGVDKYRGLSRRYEMGDVTTPTNEKMQILRQIVHSFGLQTQDF